jgi:hypothetical protein
MFNMFTRRTKSSDKRERQLREQVAELEAELAARDRTIGVMQVELDNLAAVVARDRQRVQAESATFTRQRAECEGTNGQPS